MDDPETTAEEYAHITATVDGGELVWDYKLAGASGPVKLRHDEDVTGWKDRHIIELTMSMLDVAEAQRDLIRVERI